MMWKFRTPSGSVLRKPTNTHSPSRVWTSGAANNFGSVVNGCARVRSNGPSGESAVTDHVH